MGLLDTIKKTLQDSIPDVVTNNDISGQSAEMLWKYKNNTLMTGSRLIVGESQEAIFVKNGVIEHIFGPGSYNLDTDNIPILKTLLTKAYGGTSPNTAEIWFVNKASIMEIPWGTPTPLAMEVNKFGAPLTLNFRCNGVVSVKVVDSKTIFTELAGQGRQFTVERFKDSIKSILTSRLRKAIGTMMNDGQRDYKDLQNNITDLEEPIRASVADEILRYGVNVEGCYVRGFSVVDDDALKRYNQYEDRQIRDNLDLQKESLKIDVDAKRKLVMDVNLEKARLEALGVDYETQRHYDVMQAAAENKSNPAVRTPIGVGMGMSVGSALSQQVTSDVRKVAEKKEKCPSCGASFKKGAKFCPECGYLVARVCHSCKHTDEGSGKFCPECGKKYIFCKSCGSDNPDDAASCVKCGKPLSAETVCPGCSVKIESGKKFCPECGYKLQ
ncbi:SPFH domain-containing protein [Ruminococcaceae bacterium OttesenSCG-928-L11]|nr:SPFH domain-containing protein [Ruminococcaceae bacterium OttesenSCG-928-L11]